MPITCPINFVPLNRSDFGKLDYSVMPFAFACHTELGRLANEPVYQSDFSKRLSKAGFQVRREIPVTAMYQSFTKSYYLDFVVNDRAVYELKAVSELSSIHESQLLNYLLLLDLERGKLINFRPSSVETRFVNAAISRKARQDFLVDESRWSGKESLKKLVVDILRDWGTGLELLLYEQAVTHFMGGEEEVSVMLPMRRSEEMLGEQRFNLTGIDSAFRLTAFEDQKKLPSYQRHLRSLLAISPLNAIHWINIALHRVTFFSVEAS